MAKYEIRCEDTNHEHRRGAHGWSEVLGTCELPDSVKVTHQLKGYLCEACAREARTRPGPAAPSAPVGAPRS